MINKRLLIKNLLAHNDENSFYDKKLKLDFGSREDKAKFLKHVCAMSNSNPENNSYLVIDVKDGDNTIIGVDFFDDSKIKIWSMPIWITRQSSLMKIFHFHIYQQTKLWDWSPLDQKMTIAFVL